MSQLSVNPASLAREFIAPHGDETNRPSRVNELIADVAEAVPPVWPLKDYVAVNPYLGLTERPFLEARTFLQTFSDCEILMPLSYFSAEYQAGSFGMAEIDEALGELDSVLSSLDFELSARLLVEHLEQLSAEHPAEADKPSRIQTIAELAAAESSIAWSDVISEAIAEHCSTHYDQGQATWNSPWKHLSLFQAWKQRAKIDRNLEILGIDHFRRFVSELPETPAEAIGFLLGRLDVPPPYQRVALLCQAFSLPGWCAWTTYQDRWSPQANAEPEHFASLLAIRLAYDVALHESLGIEVDWHAYPSDEQASIETQTKELSFEPAARFVLLRAMEISNRNRLLRSIAQSETERNAREWLWSGASVNTRPARKLAQMVFCIDVRSEGIRRQLEAAGEDIETFGFAGFFGMPLEYARLGSDSGDAHVPVLLKPSFCIHEGLHDSASSTERAAVEKRLFRRTWRKLWKSLQSSAVGCFSFVESTGLFYAWKLWSGTSLIGRHQSRHDRDGVSARDQEKLGPTLRGMNHQGVTTSHQADLAESMLRNLGLIDDFARLVVFCGHASQTNNNPLAASLDCGACGGHSGEPNARLAATLLNQGYIRSALAERGIEIPEETYFLGGLHQTTTDELTFFDLDLVPESHIGDVEELTNRAIVASRVARIERMPVVGSASPGDLFRRAADWSEVRPEWGLAGNAAFVVCPRWMTRTANLSGRAFLHSYDAAKDPQGNVLETIMTAPMIVAHWINMQYYASTVDHQRFGSGNKTVHNVVGQFGILSGNSGDLKTGLPWQSIHNGDSFQHQPLRLQVVIAAPRSSIEAVINKHKLVADLLTQGWLHLVAIDDGMHRYTTDRRWEPVHNQITFDCTLPASSSTRELA